MKHYDYIIVGSGLFGATFAYLANKQGKRCLVLERRKHIGGNVYTENQDGITVHKYGCHIFHTNEKAIWEFVNSLTEFVPFTYSPVANYEGELYNLPFNMNTFVKMWNDVSTPKEALDRINEQRDYKYNPANLEEQAISLVGTDIYNKLIKGYTEKQWGRQCTELSPDIIKRLPLRFTFDNNYFNDTYQGIPTNGYTALIEKLLEGIEVGLNTDFLSDKEAYMDMCDKVIFTGSIDEFFSYNLGDLQYRSVMFEDMVYPVDNEQGCPVINYTSYGVPYTRSIEHKHFDKFCKQKDKTIISFEYSREWSRGIEPYYPVNDERNNLLYQKYADYAKECYGDKVVFGGRLGMYKYLDMDDTIMAAMELYNSMK